MSRLALFGPSRGVPSVPAESQLVAYVTMEALVGLAVFACTAVLGEVTPGRHVQFERRPTTHVAPVARPGGGGPRSGTVTPPRGDAAHGRAVFGRLECATCHAIPDAQFSAPIRPGPDLAGIGGRHPGEIVESIMNPNAQILDGPGYTNEQGLSTMPDYRDRMTVGELIDLVEYLRGFEAPAAPAAPATLRRRPRLRRPPHLRRRSRPRRARRPSHRRAHARATNAHAVSRATRERQA
jgi:mono/diheme cytochrome c family protein